MLFYNETIISVCILLSVLDNPTRYESPLQMSSKNRGGICTDYFISCKMICKNENTWFRILFKNHERKL
jgi:hypothetical protein